MAEIIGDYGKPRAFALAIDNLVATILCLVVAARLPGLGSVGRWVVAAVVYLLYFLIPEAVWGKSLGKRMFGLVVYRLDGRPSGWRTASIRTVARILEVNPLLFGELPGALAVVLSKRKQRFGDMWAGTVVARIKDLPHPEKGATPELRSHALESR
jgi:uncharacterized RDD family membrane protein YckC